MQFRCGGRPALLVELFAQDVVRRPLLSLSAHGGNRGAYARGADEGHSRIHGIVPVPLPVDREIGLQSSLNFLDDDFIIKISGSHHRPPSPTASLDFFSCFGLHLPR